MNNRKHTHYTVNGSQMSFNDNKCKEKITSQRTMQSLESKLKRFPYTGFKNR